MFSTGKETAIADFNAKIEELDSEVFTGGALQRFLNASRPNTHFEPRKLSGQSCGSPDYLSDPDAECIGGQLCDEDVLLCKDADDSSNKLKGECVTRNKCGTQEYGSCCDGFGCRKTAERFNAPFGKCCAKAGSPCKSHQDCCGAEFGEDLQCKKENGLPWETMGTKRCVKEGATCPIPPDGTPFVPCCGPPGEGCWCVPSDDDRGKSGGDINICPVYPSDQIYTPRVDLHQYYSGLNLTNPNYDYLQVCSPKLSCELESLGIDLTALGILGEDVETHAVNFVMKSCQMTTGVMTVRIVQEMTKYVV